MVVDSHLHVVAGDQDRYPLRPSGVGSEWFREAPVGVEGLAPLLDPAGVDRGVLVQAVGAYGFDNDYVLDAAASDPARYTAVVAVDVASGPSEAAAALRTMVAERGAAGVRLFALNAAWIGDPETEVVWRAAADLGVPVVATILAARVAALARMLERFPGQVVALDHCGFPDLAGGPPYAEAAPLFELAEHANLHLKVSSHVLEEVGDPRDLVDRLAATFGAERLMWGSDFPQTHDRPYRSLAELGRYACSRLDAAAQEAFLGGNTARLWP